ncbi:sulfate adenylyltransferase [archaeon]|jgi:sulfate adenylyltransferase|nr:sulfate adenylyltransferase [archaeon]MDP6548010.1 sulfate adenylyltransferase [Candidatus Woesearchaeota archaeon]|tara:strand:+ start:1709 stop:2857 length:1149 start_codon:yes stop_codon:yes gene_type:complete
MNKTGDHNNKLVDRRIKNKEDTSFDVEIEVDRDVLLNIEQIANGVFSPLEGFMNESDFTSCVKKMRLSNGLVWPLPIVASIPKTKHDEIKKKNAKKSGLFYNGKLQAVLAIEDTYKLDKKSTAKKIFNTDDMHHPGVRKWVSQEDYLIGGKIKQVVPMKYEFPGHMFTPSETRQIFKDHGWKTVCGFQTRNVPHRGHENLQRIALKECDGLFIQPLIGWKKSGDFKPEAIIKAYNALIENYYSASRILLGTLSTAMFYAGPKEAIFHAIIRKNFGCTHFIVGRDHAGVSKNGKDYYETDEACRIFEDIEHEIGIKTIRIDTVYHYNIEEDEIVESLEGLDRNKYRKVSGSTVRELLQKNSSMSHGLIRPEVAKVLSRDDIIK